MTKFVASPPLRIQARIEINMFCHSGRGYFQASLVLSDAKWIDPCIAALVDKIGTPARLFIARSKK